MLVWMSRGSSWGCSRRVEVAGGFAGGRSGPGLVDTTGMSHSPGGGGTLVGSHTVAGPMMSAGSGSAGHSFHNPWRGVSRFASQTEPRELTNRTLRLRVTALPHDQRTPTSSLPVHERV